MIGVALDSLMFALMFAPPLPWFGLNGLIVSRADETIDS